MKRFRDNTGKLTMCVEAIRTETAGEARNYYQIGGKYILNSEAFLLLDDQIAMYDLVAIQYFPICHRLRLQCFLEFKPAI